MQQPPPQQLYPQQGYAPPPNQAAPPPPSQAPPNQMIQTQPPMIVQSYPNNNSCSNTISQNYNATSSLGLGITQILVGFFLIIFNIAGIVLDKHYDSLFHVGHGFWCGIFFILTGSFGVGAKTKNVCLVITFMVFSILSAIMCINVLGFAAGGIATERDDYRTYYYYTSWSVNDPHREGKLALHCLMLILAFVEAVVAIWSSAICCHAACCCRNQRGAVHAAPIQYQTVAANGTQQVVFIQTAQGQQWAPQPGGAVMYPNQTTSYPGGMAPVAGMSQQPPPGYNTSPPAYAGAPPDTGSAPEKSGNLPPAY